VEEWLAGCCYLEPDQKDDGSVIKTPPIVKRISSIFGRYLSGAYIFDWAADAMKKVYDILVECEGADFNQYASFLDPEMIDFELFEPGRIPCLPTKEALLCFYTQEDYELKLDYTDSKEVKPQVEKLVDANVELEGILGKKKEKKKSEPSGDDDLSSILKREKIKEKAVRAKGNKSSWADLAEEEDKEVKKELKKSSGPVWKPKEKAKVLKDMNVQTHVKDAEPKHVGQQPPNYEGREKKLQRLKDLKERRAMLRKTSSLAKGKKGKVNFRDIRRRLKGDLLKNDFSQFVEDDATSEVGDYEVEQFQEMVDKIYDEEMEKLEKEVQERDRKEENEVFDLPGQTDEGDFTELSKKLSSIRHL